MSNTFAVPGPLLPTLEAVVFHSVEAVFQEVAFGRLGAPEALERVAQALLLEEQCSRGELEDSSAPLLYDFLLCHLECRRVAGELSGEELLEIEALEEWLGALWSRLEEREAAGAAGASQ